MQSTREKLIEAARALFADRGIEHVSLREISRAAEQGNVSALQYHFGDREGLLRAVLEPYSREVDARRNSLLDHLEATPGAELRDLAAVLVRPPAALLGEPGGRQFLRIFAQLVTQPDPAAYTAAGGGESPSIKRWRKAAEAWLPEDALPLHRRFTAIQLTHIELGRRAAVSKRDHRLFTSHLVDLAAAILAAPVSDETHGLLAEKSGGRRRRD